MTCKGFLIWSPSPNRSLANLPQGLVGTQGLVVAYRIFAFVGSQYLPDSPSPNSVDLGGDLPPSDSKPADLPSVLEGAITERVFPTAAAEKKRNAKRRAKELGIEWVTNKTEEIC